MTEPKPTYVIPWKQALVEQEQEVAQGIDPVKVDKLRQAAIALIRACDDLQHGDKGYTIPVRQR